MAIVEFALFWLPLLFALLVTGSYVGTKLALRSYFEGDDPRPSEFVSVEGDEDR